MSTVERTIAPEGMAVDLDEALTYLRVDGDELSTETRQLIDRATAYCEEYQWTQLLSATFVERWDSGFPECLKPTKCPLISVTSLTYVDAAGVTQALIEGTHFVVDKYSKPARIVPAFGTSWPATRAFMNAVSLTYVAGFGTSPRDVPGTTRQAILMLAAHWEKHHESVGDVSGPVAFSTKSLLDLNSYRRFF